MERAFSRSLSSLSSSLSVPYIFCDALEADLSAGVLGRSISSISSLFLLLAPSLDGLLLGYNNNNKFYNACQ